MDKNDPISVLVIDDSALMRNLVSRIIESSPDLTVVATAMNGRFGLQKLDSHQPDAIVLDLEMPELNGIGFLAEKFKRNNDVPVIILSSIAQKGAAVTMEALGLGAKDFISKPSGSVSEDIHVIGTQLIDLLKFHGRNFKRLSNRKPLLIKDKEALNNDPKLPEPEHEEEKAIPRTYTFSPVTHTTPEIKVDSSRPIIVPKTKPGKLEIIAIGISTGGPNALRQVFAELDSHIKVPILVVQHMPAGFTAEFAKSLDRICPLEVKEASDGDLIKPGRILIAPGDFHIKVERKSLAPILRLDSGPAQNGHRPSADVLFKSIAESYGNSALGIIMTGMGKDGAEQIGRIFEAGGITIGQDQESSVVYGMPRIAFEMGHITRQVSLKNMATTINQIALELV